MGRQKTPSPPNSNNLPKCNSDHITPSSFLLATHRSPTSVKSELLGSSSCRSSTSDPPALCLTGSVPVSPPCCSTHRASQPQDLHLLPSSEVTTLGTLPSSVSCSIQVSAKCQRDGSGRAFPEPNPKHRLPGHWSPSAQPCLLSPPGIFRTRARLSTPSSGPPLRGAGSLDRPFPPH